MSANEKQMASVWVMAGGKLIDDMLVGESTMADLMYEYDPFNSDDSREAYMAERNEGMVCDG